MSFNSRLKTGQKALTATATGAVAVGTVKAGNTISCDGIDLKSLAADIDMAITTSSVTLTPSWQVSDDASTWKALFAMNSAANVATAAGTGSVVTTSRTVSFPGTAARYVRAVVTTGGATAGATVDTYAISYRYLLNE